MTWLDKYLNDIIQIIVSSSSYFVDIASLIAKAVITISFIAVSVGMILGSNKFSEMFKKLIINYSIFLFVLVSYPNIQEGLKSLAVTIGYKSIYETVIDPKLDSLDDNDLIKQVTENSEIIKELDQTLGDSALRIYVGEIFDEENNVLSINSSGKLIMLVGEQILIKIKREWRNVGQAILLIIIFLFMVVTSVLSMSMYAISVIEFHIITTAGIILLPFMLWSGTKFISEKLIGAILGQTLKLVLTTFAFMIVTAMSLNLLINIITSIQNPLTIDLIFEIIFFVFLGYTITLSSGQLATALMTGTPQLGFADLAVGAAATKMFADKTVGKGAKAVGSGVKNTAINTSKVAGAVKGTKEAGGNLKDSIGAGAKQVGANIKGDAASLGKSAWNSTGGKAFGKIEKPVGNEKYTSQTKQGNNAPQLEGLNKDEEGISPIVSPNGVVDTKNTGAGKESVLDKNKGESKERKSGDARRIDENNKITGATRNVSQKEAKDSAFSETFLNAQKNQVAKNEKRDFPKLGKMSNDSEGYQGNMQKSLDSPQKQNKLTNNSPKTKQITTDIKQGEGFITKMNNEQSKNPNSSKLIKGDK